MCSDPRSAGCRELFHQECVNIGVVRYYDTWNDDPFCSSVIEDNIYNDNGTINVDGMKWAQSQMDELFYNYLTEYGANPEGKLQPLGRAEPFQDYLYGLCMDLPQACETALNRWCSEYDRTTVGPLANFCGCHLLPFVYAPYSNQYAIEKDCDPLCARLTTIPYVNENGIIQICHSNICIIDDVTLTLVDTDVGDINFIQACGGCTGTATCRCSISDVTLGAVESTLGDINLSEQCLGGLTCYQTGVNGEPIRVDCDTNTPITEDEAVNQAMAENRKIVLIMLVVFISLLVILGLILILVATKKTPQTVYQIKKESPKNG